VLLERTFCITVTLGGRSQSTIQYPRLQSSPDYASRWRSGASPWVSLNGLRRLGQGSASNRCRRSASSGARFEQAVLGKTAHDDGGDGWRAKTLCLCLLSGVGRSDNTERRWTIMIFVERKHRCQADGPRFFAKRIDPSPAVKDMQHPHGKGVSFGRSDDESSCWRRSHRTFKALELEIRRGCRFTVWGATSFPLLAF